MRVFKPRQGDKSADVPELDIEQAIVDRLGDVDYSFDSPGVVEELRAQLGNHATMLGQLVTILAENGVLTADNVSSLLGHRFKVLP